MKLELSAFVVADLSAIDSYISNHSPDYAVRILTRLRQEIRYIAAAPFQYRARPDLATHARSAAVGKYVILFTAHDDKRLRIERVVHGARDLANLYREALSKG